MGAEVKTVIILPDKFWQRGKGVGNLLVEDHRGRLQCCIGVACTQLGVKDKDLEDTEVLTDLDDREGVEIPAVLDALRDTDISPELRQRLGNEAGIYLTGDNSTLDHFCYSVNDNTLLDDEKRLELLNKLGAPVGLCFVLEK